MNKKTNRLHSSQKNVALSANNREQIHAYFEQVLNLRNSGNPFPVDLDEVWPLVYPYKKNAVDILINEYIEGTEYVAQNTSYEVFTKKGKNLGDMQSTDTQRFTQKGKSKVGGRPSNKYYISIECMQYLIARKRRYLFDIYIQVFNLVVDASIPIAGVYPVLLQGKILYPYTPLLKAIGYSTRSGSVQSRRRQYPQHFVKYTDRNWITPEMANLLVQQRETIVLQEKLKHAQQFLPFKEDEV